MEWELLFFLINNDSQFRCTFMVSVMIITVDDFEVCKQNGGIVE